jgi:hypothetical protein
MRVHKKSALGRRTLPRSLSPYTDIHNWDNTSTNMSMGMMTGWRLDAGIVVLASAVAIEYWH